MGIFSWVRRPALIVSTLFALCSLFSPRVLRAQFTTSIEGRVTDPSQAAIPNAQVVVENTATGVKRTVATSTEGYYRVQSLPAGVFTVRVSATGFQTQVAENVELQADQVKTYNIQLKLGAATTEISITGEVPLVETGEARVSNHVETRQVEDLPLVGRNFMNLVVLTPGVTGLPSGGGQAYAQATGDIFSAEYGVNMNANGQRAESNNFLVDSASVNGSPRGGVTNFSPSADAVQELRISVNNFSAEYGRNSSAVVNVITKSGTNQYHGTGGWYHTNNRLQAHSVFQPEVPVFRRNEYNGTLGGPIIKNKLFGFGSFDILKSGLGLGFADSALTPEFTNIVKQRYPNNISTKIITSYPSQLSKLSNGQYAGPLAGAVADVAGCNGLAGGPSANVNTPIGALPCNLPVTFNGSFAQTVPRNGWQWLGRIDYNFHQDKDRLYFFMGKTDNHQTSFGTPSVYPDFTTFQEEYTAHFNANWTHIFSPTVLNEASWSGTRAWGQVPIAHGEIPQVNIPGIASYGNGFADATFIQNNQEWRDVIAWNRGVHAFRFGGIVQCTSGCPGAGALFSAVFTRPYFDFNNIFDFVKDDPFGETNIGFDPKTGNTFGPDFKPNFVNFGFFVQDTWKARPNLTLTYGLRWEVYLNPTEQNNLFVRATFPTGSNFHDRLANMKPVQGQPLDKTDLNNFAPRLGIAWDPTKHGNTSIRAGFGVFYDRPAGQFFRDCCTTLPLFGQTSVRKDTPPALPAYGLSSTTSKPWKFPAIPGLSPGLDARNGLIGVRAYEEVWDPSMLTQYSFNWFFGVQRSFGRDWAIEANYVGSRGSKTYLKYDVNRFAGDLLDGVLNRINPSFGEIEYGQANGKSFYHGFNAAVRKRFSGGLDLQLGYTYGRAIDYASSFGGGLNIIDVDNLKLNRGLADFDIRHKVAFNALYDIPTPWKSGIANGVLGGWQFGVVTIIQSGSPFWPHCGLSFSEGCDFNADGWNFDPLNAPSFSQRSGWTKQEWLSGAFSRNAFPKPAVGRNGNLGRNTFIGPAYNNTNATLQKYFRITEKTKLNFRSEFYNIFNQTNLTGIRDDTGDSLFGQATSAYSMRNLQLGLKFIF